MTHLIITWNTQGYTVEMIGDMTRKEFSECPLPHYMKVSMLRESINRKEGKK